MFINPSNTTLFQLVKPLPFGKFLFNRWLNLNHSYGSGKFAPYVISLKPMYCETLIHFRRAYKNNAGHFKHSIIMQLCDFTFHMALDSQSKLVIQRRPYKLEMEILKEAKSQISAICDLQEQTTKNKISLFVHDLDGDQIAVATYHLAAEPKAKN